MVTAALVVALLVCAAAIYLLDNRRFRVAERAVSLWELMICGAILAVFAIIISSNLSQVKPQTAVEACEAQLRAIQTAAEQYNQATQTYPAGTAVAVTATLFQNPNNTAVSYLGTQPIDPGDPPQTGTYSWTYTAPTASAAGYYVISCPGLHQKEQMVGVQGAGTGTTGHLYIDSRKGAPYTQ